MVVCVSGSKGGMDMRVESDVLGYIMGKHDALVGMGTGGGLWTFSGVAQSMYGD